MNPKHEIWQRCRWRHHGGATRSYAKPPSPRYGRTSPIYCEHCTRISALELSSGERYREDGEEEEEEIEEEGSEEIGGRYGARKVTQCFNDLLDEIDFSTGVIGSKLVICFWICVLHYQGLYYTYIYCPTLSYTKVLMLVLSGY